MFVYQKTKKITIEKTGTVCNQCGQIIEISDNFCTGTIEQYNIIINDPNKPPSFHLCSECTEELTKTFIIPINTDNEIELILSCETE